MTDANEMWAVLEQYQPYADKAGYGESWKRMTIERTSEAAHQAATAALVARDAAGSAAVVVWWTLRDAEDAKVIIKMVMVFIAVLAATAVGAGAASTTTAAVYAALSAVLGTAAWAIAKAAKSKWRRERVVEVIKETMETRHD